MPTGIERYGIIYSLDDTTLSRLQTGFTEIRERSGWSNFRIPSYVWDYVDETERDRLLTWLQTAIWTTRSDDSNYADVSREEHLAWSYFWGLLAEWWSDCATVERPAPTLTAVTAMLHDDCGIPSSATSRLATYVADEEIKGRIYAPSGDEDYRAWLDVYRDSTEYSYFWVQTGGGPNYEGQPIEIYCECSSEASTYTEFYDYATYTNETYTEASGDYGVAATWPDSAYTVLSENIAAVCDETEYEVLSGSATFRNFGLMEGQITLTTSLDVGSEVVVSQDFEALFTGIVTQVRQNLAEGTYEHRLADPVTAGGGTVEYTSGNAIDALQEALEAHGGTFSTEMTTIETVFYPDEPQDAYQFFRAVSYAVGGVLQYGRDGVYRLVATPTEHNLSDSEIIADDGPTIEERTGEYANYVTVSIDERWRTTATTTTTETYSVGGNSVSIERLGEQIQSVTVSYDGGAGKSISYTYDANGYLTNINETHQTGSSTGDEKFERSVSFTNISADGNQYDVSIVEKTYQYNQYYDSATGTYSSGWTQQTENTKTWNVDLTSLSKVEEVQKGLDLIAKAMWTTDVMYYDDSNPDGVKRESTVSIPISPSDYSGWPQLINQHKWIASVISAPDADVLEGHCESEQYNYVVTRIEADSYGLPVARLGWARVNPARAEEKSYSPPTLEMYAAEDEHEVHIIAKAKDPGAVTALGEHKYETRAVALDTSTGMTAFALGVLREKSRIRKASIAIAMGTALPLDTVIWRGLEWTLSGVTVNLDGANENLEMATQSTTTRLSGALSKEPVTWTEDVRNAINKRVGQFDNIARGKVTGRAGYRRYTVQVEGKTDTVEAKALDSKVVPTGSSVLVIRPTGKNQQWTLFSPSKEDEIVIPTTAEENITPSNDPTPPAITSFTADQYTTTPCYERTLSWTFEEDAYDLGVDIDPGDGGDVIEVEGYGDPKTYDYRFMTVGTLTPTITPWVRNIHGEKTYGTAVSLANDMFVSGPEITSFDKATGDVLFGQTHEIQVQACYVPGLEILVDHGDGLGYVTYNTIDDATGLHVHSYTWYQTGTYELSAKLRFTQNNGEVWETETPETLEITVVEDSEAAGSTVTISGTEYVVLPVEGELEYDASPVTVIDPLMALTPPSALSAYGAGGTQMNFEIQFTVTGGASIDVDDGAVVYLVNPRMWHPKADCGGETNYNEWVKALWALKVQKNNEGKLVFDSRTLAVTSTNWYWSSYYGSQHTLEETCPTEWSKTITITRNPNAFEKGILTVDGEEITSQLYLCRGFRGGYFAYETDYVPDGNGRLWKSIAKSAWGGIGFSGNVLVKIPQQLVVAVPAIIPGDNCELVWTEPEY